MRGSQPRLHVEIPNQLNPNPKVGADSVCKSCQGCCGMTGLETSGLNIPGVKTAGQDSGSPPLLRPAKTPRVNRKFVVQCSLGWESRTSSWIYNECLPSVEVEFPFMCVSNPMLSTQSVFTPAVGSGVPQAERGWGAEQPGGSSQPQIPPPGLGLSKIPLQASGPV